MCTEVKMRDFANGFGPVVDAIVLFEVEGEIGGWHGGGQAKLGSVQIVPGKTQPVVVHQLLRAAPAKLIRTLFGRRRRPEFGILVNIFELYATFNFYFKVNHTLTIRILLVSSLPRHVSSDRVSRLRRFMRFSQQYMPAAATVIN